VIDALNPLVAKHPAIGFWQAYHRLRLIGRPWNHKRVYPIYTALGLNMRRPAKKRLPAGVTQRLFQPAKPSQV
jgi:putative transposase